MMSKKSPQLRFEGFTDDWEQHRLGEVTEISKGVQRGKQEISEIQTSENPYPVYNGGQDVSGFTDEYNRENKVMVSEGGASAGYVNYFSDRYWSGGHNFTIDNLDNDLYFIKSILDANQQKLYGLKVGSGLPNVQLGAIKNFDICIPSTDEQIKIGSFFATIDSLITLHQRKLDLLKEQKKGYLQKMFPKTGEKVPELRFEGFTEDWEERKLGEVTKSFDGKRVPIDSGLRISGEYPYYGASGIIDYVDDYIFDGEYVLLAEDGANITTRNYPVAYLTQGKFWLNNHAHIMRMIDGSNYFLVQVLEKIDYIKYNTGTAQPKLNSKVVKNIEFKLPHVNEQRKIGTFFKQIDKTIALHQRKLDFLKEQKKGFLQKMFV